MKALFIIAEYAMHEKIPKILSKSHVPFKVVLHGSGAADSKILDYLGIGDNKKTVCLSVANDKDIPHIYRLLEHHMSISRAGRGIAFTIQIDGASGAIVKAYEQLAADTSGEDKEVYENMSTHQHEMIVTIAERGSFDTVKEAAKGAGARGGTLIHGLGMGGEEAAKFFGISIQPEKDIVMIVVNKENSSAVMKSILEAAGLNTAHRGVCFSLPVDSAFGLAGKLDSQDMKLD